MDDNSNTRISDTPQHFSSISEKSIFVDDPESTCDDLLTFFTDLFPGGENRRENRRLAEIEHLAQFEEVRGKAVCVKSGWSHTFSGMVGVGEVIHPRDYDKVRVVSNK